MTIFNYLKMIKQLKQLFFQREKNFNSLSEALSPLMLNDKFIFLQIYTLKGNRGKRRLTFQKQSILLILFQIFLISYLIASSVLYSLSEIDKTINYFNSTNTYSALDNFVYYFSEYYIILFIFISILFFNINHKNISQILNMSDEIDILLMKLNVTLKYQLVNNYCLKCIIFLNSCTFIVILQQAMFLQQLYSTFRHFLTFTGYLIGNSIISSISGHVCIILYDIELKFVLVNIELISHNTKNKVNNGNYLNNVVRIFCKINIYCQQVNRVFNSLLFLLFVQTFTFETVTNYFVVVYLFDAYKHRFNLVKFIIFIWNFYNIHKVILIFYQVKKTLTQVCIIIYMFFISLFFT